ncbi:hypothetical protein FACS1894219_03780 [Clostridia bacterium]|nr:hypothetical protein FACS1894219_03780 [Clostridia bacterium]
MSTQENDKNPDNASVRIAFASIDGGAVDSHFGSARYFQIYDVYLRDDHDGEVFSHAETRRTDAKCKGSCESGFGHLVKLLEDCKAVFALKVGGGAASAMLTAGIRVFEAAGEIEEIIAELISNGMLEENCNEVSQQ